MTCVTSAWFEATYSQAKCRRSGAGAAAIAILLLALSGSLTAHGADPDAAAKAAAAKVMAARLKNCNIHVGLNEPQPDKRIAETEIGEVLLANITVRVPDLVVGEDLAWVLDHGGLTAFGKIEHLTINTRSLLRKVPDPHEYSEQIAKAKALLNTVDDARAVFLFGRPISGDFYFFLKNCEGIESFSAIDSSDESPVNLFEALELQQLTDATLYGEFRSESVVRVSAAPNLSRLSVKSPVLEPQLVDQFQGRRLDVLTLADCPLIDGTALAKLVEGNQLRSIECESRLLDSTACEAILKSQAVEEVVIADKKRDWKRIEEIRATLASKKVRVKNRNYKDSHGNLRDERG